MVNRILGIKNNLRKRVTGKNLNLLQALKVQIKELSQCKEQKDKEMKNTRKKCYRVPSIHLVEIPEREDRQRRGNYEKTTNIRKISRATRLRGPRTNPSRTSHSLNKWFLSPCCVSDIECSSG